MVLVGLFVIAVLLLILHVFGFFRQSNALIERSKDVRSKEKRVSTLIKPHPMDEDDQPNANILYNSSGGQSSRFRHRRHRRRR